MNVQKINYQKEMEKILDELHCRGKCIQIRLCFLCIL